MKLKKLTPARLIALSFFAVIAVGAGLLMLPVASKGAPAAPLDALFTATAEYMSRRKKGIEFFPGKDAPLPEEEIAADELSAEETTAEHTWISKTGEDVQAEVAKKNE